jgi:hypothetical protein
MVQPSTSARVGMAGIAPWRLVVILAALWAKGKYIHLVEPYFFYLKKTLLNILKI